MLQDRKLHGGAGFLWKKDGAAPTKVCTAIGATLAVLQLNCAAPPPIAPMPSPQHTEPAWSPSGDTIAYTHGAQIWFANTRTGERTLVTTGAEPTWSPDGLHLAFIRGEALFMRDTQSQQEQQLAVPRCHDPAWSPDGAWIAFDWDYSDPTGTPVISLIQANGTNARDISSHGTGSWLEPQWSPDGERLLHVRFLLGVTGGELFVMDTTGAEARRITFDGNSDRDASWSPDGSRIVWVVVPAADPTSWGTWVMQGDGTNRRRLIAAGSRPRWSPDGKRIAFAKYSAADSGVVLWTMNADGTSAMPLPRL